MEIQELLKKFREYSNQEPTLIELAYQFSKEAHLNQTRASGEIYFTHCMAVAEILADFRMDMETVSAGMLHDVLEDTKTPHEVLKKEFGEEIYNLVLGVTKIDSLKFSSRDEAQAENWRRMLLATAKDIRVIIIKLADRLHNMRTLDYLSPEKQVEISQETVSLYAPLAQRLGMFEIKSELEDLIFKHLHKSEYESIFAQVQSQFARREESLERFKKELEKHLSSSNIPYRLLSRAKNLYSIYRKMQIQNRPFEEIQDALGVRIITDSILNCYAILGVAHSVFKPIAGTFTDYISVPKMNLYQSLHTTVVSPSGDPVEIQIRTEDMHRTAEYGIAAHWKYKVGEKEKDDHLNEKLNWLRQWIEWLQDMSSPREFIESFKTELDLDQIFVFTPKGEVKALPSGSTPIDFAYAVHSDIGNACIGAKINNKIVKLEYHIKSGEIVEILTRKNAVPSPDWLKIVRTARARSKIRKYLREHKLLEE
ncbi:MAG: bifunctional (p)ppGpp synthetase/guanosine-3',5'-bis(diphosphate) 3'-pyrophosphohydrolase [Elusimicrobia bacterium]|nr:bifunctional (p)ppGpp synthetase/guanosine-3',5'-bis(diphosphate) 3'-pyrophosphohydrolase [Elusimicrobiota bacterium]